MNSTLRQASRLDELIWSCVEDGFYVASRDNKFLGFVDRISPDVYQVCDANSQQIGLLATLEAAQQCLIAWLRPNDSVSASAEEE